MLELKRDPKNTTQISDPPQGGKSSLKFVMILCAEEAKLVDKREPSSKIFTRPDKGGNTELFGNMIMYHHERLDATKIPIPVKPSNLLFTFLAPLASQKCQMCPRL